MWKVPAISGIISVVLFVIATTMIHNMSPSELIRNKLYGDSPKRITVVSTLWLLSAIFSIISLIVCIVKA